MGGAVLMWALAKMGIKPDAGLLEAFQGQARETAGEFNPNSVAILMWSMAKMGIKPDVGLLEAMQGQASGTAGDFRPTGVPRPEENAHPPRNPLEP